MDPFGILGKTITTGGADGYLADEGGHLTAPAKLNGRWSVEEFQPYDPSAHCHEAGYVLYRDGVEAYLPLVEEPTTHPEQWCGVIGLDKRVKIAEEA